MEQRVWYHVTPSEYADAIEREGLVIDPRELSCYQKDRGSFTEPNALHVADSPHEGIVKFCHGEGVENFTMVTFEVSLDGIPADMIREGWDGEGTLAVYCDIPSSRLKRLAPRTNG